ncbi:MAG: hypothetical protein KZQ83_18530 [gamma proteobacterium symbiont of Taylorina sp.]|nr:hypothetical protein [gamma proteobacterium symbiont of Taylorina sp.]
MPFVQRDKDNKITALFSEQQPYAKEKLESGSQEIISFLNTKEQNHLLHQSDAEFIRVLEDLITVLLDKHVFLLTDLPAAAQEKLLKRQKIRKDYIDFIVSDDEEIF